MFVPKDYRSRGRGVQDKKGRGVQWEDGTEGRVGRVPDREGWGGRTGVEDGNELYGSPYKSENGTVRGPDLVGVKENRPG